MVCKARRVVRGSLFIASAAKGTRILAEVPTAADAGEQQNSQTVNTGREDDLTGSRRKENRLEVHRAQCPLADLR